MSESIVVVKTQSLLAAGSFALITLIGTSAKADEKALIACIAKFKEIGLSADLAYAECKQSSLGECIKNLLGKNYIAKSIEEKSNGYLVDLGNNDTRWLEGGSWKDLGCTPYTEGPKRRQQSMTVWGFDSVNTWFRQGICSKEAVELDQPYSPEEAKSACELREVGIKTEEQTDS